MKREVSEFLEVKNHCSLSKTRLVNSRESECFFRRVKGLDVGWSRLRTLLREKGIDPDQAILAESFPDGTSFEFGIVVAEDGRVFQFGYDYLGKSIGEGRFLEWVDLTRGYERTPHSEIIADAIDMAKQQKEKTGQQGG